MMNKQCEICNQPKRPDCINGFESAPVEIHWRGGMTKKLVVCKNKQEVPLISPSNHEPGLWDYLLFSVFPIMIIFLISYLINM